MSQPNRRLFLGASALAAGSLAATRVVDASESNQEVDDVLISELGKTPHSKFAVNIEMWWNDLPFLDRLRKASEFGYPAVEFWPFQNKDIGAIADLSADLGVEIAQFTAWGFAPGMNNPDNEDAFIDRITRACAVAHDLRCKKMTVVAGNNQEGMSQDAMLAQVTKALKRASSILEDNNVMAILEPMNGRVDHPGHCLYGSVDAVNICREVDSPMVKINWDLYHMQITEGDLCGRLRDGFDQVGYLQLADHPGRNEPGTGEIHYNRVLQEAQSLGYEGFVGLECRPKTTEEAAARGVHAADQW